MPKNQFNNFQHDNRFIFCNVIKQMFLIQIISKHTSARNSADVTPVSSLSSLMAAFLRSSPLLAPPCITQTWDSYYMHVIESTVFKDLEDEKFKMFQTFEPKLPRAKSTALMFPCITSLRKALRWTTMLPYSICTDLII